MWENEFKSKGWRFVSSSYNMVKLVLTLIKKGFIPTQNCMDQKLMQSVQNVETSKEPQYVVSTKSCRIQKEGAERRGLLCVSFWINNDKWMLKKDRPSKKLPSHPPYLSHCLRPDTRKLQDKCGGTHLR